MPKCFIRSFFCWLSLLPHHHLNIRGSYLSFLKTCTKIPCFYGWAFLFPSCSNPLAHSKKIFVLLIFKSQICVMFNLRVTFCSISEISSVHCRSYLFFNCRVIFYSYSESYLFFILRVIFCSISEMFSSIPSSGIFHSISESSIIHSQSYHLFCFKTIFCSNSELSFVHYQGVNCCISELLYFKITSSYLCID